MLDRLISLVAPHECLSCGKQAGLLCADCQKSLPSAADRCWRCQKLSDLGRTCPACRRSSGLFSVQAVTSYDGFGGELIRRLKYHGAVAAAQDIAGLLANVLPTEHFILTYLPTATSRVRSRGFDQAKLIAKAVAAETGCSFVPFLKRLGQVDQVGTDRASRFAQAGSMFRAVNRSLLTGQKVVLIDDVITTGASLDSAAKVLKASGAKRVYGVVFCQA